MRTRISGVFRVNINYYLGRFVVRSVEDSCYNYYAHFYILSKGKVIKIGLGYSQISYIGANDVINYINIL